MKRLAYLLAIAFAPLLAQAQQSDLVNDSIAAEAQMHINKFADSPGLEYASLGICVRDIATGEEIASHDPDLAICTASTMKAITASTALELLGPNYRFHTTVRLDGEVADSILVGNIVIIGGGDPTLGTRHDNNRGSLQQAIADSVKALGIKAIKGNILTDESLIKGCPVNPRWQVEDLPTDYAPGVHAINYRDNIVSLRINKAGACSLQPNIDMCVENHTTRGEKDVEMVLGLGDKPVLSVYGTLNGPLNEQVANPNPAALLVREVKDALQQQDIAVIGDSLMPTEGKTIVDFQSDMLREILHTLLLKSDNMYTDAVLRAIARAKGNECSFKGGVKTVKDYWSNRGLPMDALFMYDGSGLSRNNKCTASLMTQILHTVNTDSTAIGMKLSTIMTRLGEDGNIGNSMAIKACKLKGRIASKSGSMADVQCYTGYFPYDNPRYSWAILVNNYNMKRATLKNRIDALLAKLFTTLK